MHNQSSILTRVRSHTAMRESLKHLTREARKLRTGSVHADGKVDKNGGTDSNSAQECS